MDYRVLKTALAELTRFMGQQGIIIDPLPRLILQYNPAYADQVSCPTAHYSPVDKSITLQTAGRHIKDVLRSYAHELYHHHQNCEGLMPKEACESTTDPNYAQNNANLRRLEAEAYMKGNLLFRDWTDLRRS